MPARTIPRKDGNGRVGGSQQAAPADILRGVDLPAHQTVAQDAAVELSCSAQASAGVWEGVLHQWIILKRSAEGLGGVLKVFGRQADGRRLRHQNDCRYSYGPGTILRVPVVARSSLDLLAPFTGLARGAGQGPPFQGPFQGGWQVCTARLASPFTGFLAVWL